MSVGCRHSKCFVWFFRSIVFSSACMSRFVAGMCSIRILVFSSNVWNYRPNECASNEIMHSVHTVNGTRSESCMFKCHTLTKQRIEAHAHIHIEPYRRAHMVSAILDVYFFYFFILLWLLRLSDIENKKNDLTHCRLTGRWESFLLFHRFLHPRFWSHFQPSWWMN